ncbi:MAG: hydantoinase/oxoprolinase family protein, partial [Alphaproteobacteria bacterium]|nr:hydantoinase/oxoprolinase family protein [Alphaproteobacteria bacterium]
MRSEYRLGVDAGGTFTDFVLADQKGEIRLYKALSTPDDPTIALKEGLGLIAEDIGRSTEDIVSNCDLCINGTTVGLNALIQHKGAKTGLICTAGHEDSIEIRLGHNEDGYRYDATYPPAVMLVPRYLRCGIRERVISTGAVHTPLHEDDVAAACDLFKKEGVESVAISFVWSVLNPDHERRAAAIVRELMPAALLTVGSELYPQVREYTRTSTAVTNAYLGPTLKRYVDAIDGYFQPLGARYPVRYFQSNGGLALGEVMTDRSVYAINSGPASAPQAGLHFTAPFGHDNVITTDMGGTSFDITLTKDGNTNVNKNIDFLRYRIGVPMIQVETLGAGGGSIAWIDDYGLLQVGPQSAGADPGPACYGQGGVLPTVTDANLVLGYLNPDHLLGGRMKVHRERAERAVKEKIAEPLNLPLDQAAFGIVTIVNANMANGIRRVSVERGFDPRDFVLVAAGGAGALHVAALAKEMGINTVIVPKLASGLCAFGQIISNVKYSAMAACPLRLDDKADVKQLNALYANIEAGAIANLEADGFIGEQIQIRRSMDMRYVGQVHECAVE